jgi:hypothetical protein
MKTSVTKGKDIYDIHLFMGYLMTLNYSDYSTE